MKLTFVLGLSCGGKSYTADRLNDVALVIQGNVIVDAVFSELDEMYGTRSELSPQEKTQALIEELEAKSVGRYSVHTDLANMKRAIYKSVIAEYGYAASKARAIVVEGEVFCMFVIRQAVEHALKICLFNFDKKKTFYLDPPSDVILANARKAGVQIVANQTVQQLDELKNEWNRKMTELPLHCCRNTIDLEADIRSYLKQ